MLRMSQKNTQFLTGYMNGFIKKVLVRHTIINTIASSVQAKAPGTVLPDK